VQAVALIEKVREFFAQSKNNLGGAECDILVLVNKKADEVAERIIQVSQAHSSPKILNSHGWVPWRDTGEWDAKWACLTNQFTGGWHAGPGGHGAHDPVRFPGHEQAA
jgi:hypothetical protein